MKKKDKTSSYGRYRRSGTFEEERQSWENEKKRLEFRLSHQSECFINCVRQEELELATAIQMLRTLDEISESFIEDFPMR